jgi:hypothetical protein
MRTACIPTTRRSLLESLEPRQLLASVTTYLSDLTPAVAPTNGWGPIEEDRSNGELGANDGTTMRVNGNTYNKGLGVHANSEVQYDIQASWAYSTFQADVGVDDEVGSNGSVVFQVWLGTNKVYDSGVKTGNDTVGVVNVGIGGFTGRLRLVVTDAGNGNTFDHADWGVARLVAPNDTQVVSVFPTTNGQMSENGGSAGYSIERQGPPVNPVTVNFNVGGTATRGSDYVLRLGDANGSIITGNSITIPAGQTSVLMTATSVNDTVVEPQEDILLTLAAGTGYTVGSPNTVSTNINDDDPSSGSAYLTDFQINSSTNGWGPVEIDQSNGEQPAGDGKTLTLNGTTYARGLGVHAGSNVLYNLLGNYSTFSAVIGVDDEVGNNGSVIFQVYADSVKVYESAVLTGSQGGVPISVNIAGAQQLRLVVTDAGNGNAFDHADWADAKLTVDSGGTSRISVVDRTILPLYEGGRERFIVEVTGDDNSPAFGFDYETYDISATANADYEPLSGHVDVPAGTGYATYSFYVTALEDNVFERTEQVGFRIKNVTNGTFVNNPSSYFNIPGQFDTVLSALTPASQSNGWGPVEKDKSNGELPSGDGKTLTINGQTFSNGLGVHANSDITYNIANQGYKAFSSYVGIDDEVGNNGSAIFQVFVDGVKKYDSGILTGSMPASLFNIDVTNASTLRLVVTDAGNGNTFDHADWADALLGGR